LVFDKFQGLNSIDPFWSFSNCIGSHGARLCINYKSTDGFFSENPLFAYLVIINTDFQHHQFQN
jgi:hypothetical protein